ncbi:hypothetical protein [uncultured Mediterranean phage]|nr:hypothetical protein [uncultured Mediterranean phage]
MSFVKSAALKADKGISTGTTDIEAAMGRLGDAANGVLSSTAAAGKRVVGGTKRRVAGLVDGATGMLHTVAGHIERLGRTASERTRDFADNIGTVADDAARKGEGFTKGVADDTRKVARRVQQFGGACGCRGRRAGRKRHIGGGTRSRRRRGGRRSAATAPVPFPGSRNLVKSIAQPFKLSDVRGRRAVVRGGRRKRRGGRRTRRRGGRRTRRRGGRRTRRRGGRRKRRGRRGGRRTRRRRGGLCEGRGTAVVPTTSGAPVVVCLAGGRSTRRRRQR